MKRLLIFLVPLLFCTQAEAVRFRKVRGPLYWTGTNCRAQGSPVNISAGEVGIEAYEVRVNDTVVYPWVKDGATTGSTSGGTAFDSTNFENGDLVEVKTYAKAKLTDGTITDWQDDGGYSAVVINRSLIATTTATFFILRLNGVLAPQTGTAVRYGQDTRLQTMNYERKLLGHYDNGLAEWQLSDFLSDATGKSVVTLNTHGDATSALCMDGTSPDPTNLGAWTINPLDLFLNQVYEVGQDALPPYNSSFTPPISLLYLGACNQGWFVPDWAFGALWPYQFSGGLFLENQAAFGLKPYITGAGTSTISNGVFEQLKKGETLAEAIRIFCETTITDSVCDSINLATDQAVNPRRAIKEDFVIYGDPNMRIHGVFTGSSSKSSTWWRK